MSGVRLVWDDKTAEVPRLSMPLQVVETVNSPRADRGTIFEQASSGDSDGWRNRLIWGDNLHALVSLADELAGQIDLIYIDPPFDSRQDYKVRISVGDSADGADQDLSKLSSVVEEKAYRDTWGNGADSYLQMLYQRFIVMRRLMSDHGSICVHVSAQIGNQVGLLMDEIFGADRFVNEIIWRYGKMSNATRKFPNNHDRILVYSKTENYYFFPIKSTESEYKARFLRFVQNNRISYGSVANSQDKLVLGRIKKLVKELGRPLRPDDVLFDFDAEFKTQDDVFYDISIIKGNAAENLAYDTQKPEKLIQRVIEAFSPPRALVLDCFAGSGTTPAVAEKLGRKWVAVDIGRFAIHTTRKRLMDIPQCKPFEVANLGRYERQVWQQATTGEAYSAYLDFVVALYGAVPLDSFTYLHGTLDAHAVHVGAVDAPVSGAEIKDAVEEARSAGYTALDVLGWEWELGLHDMIADEARARGVHLRLRRIPREVMDPRVVASGEFVFHELAYAKVATTVRKCTVDVTLEDFVLPNPELVPTGVRDKITGWADYVDYWAVDFTFEQGGAHGADDTFRNQWQSYRTRASRSLELTAQHTYDDPGPHTVLVKVVDVFGNDSTTAVPVSVK